MIHVRGAGFVIGKATLDGGGAHQVDGHLHNHLNGGHLGDVSRCAVNGGFAHGTVHW